MIFSVRKVLLIAARDFWAIVQTKSFLIGLLAFVFLSLISPGMMFLSQIRASYRIGVLDPTGVYLQELPKRINDPSHFTFVSLGTDSEQKALDRVKAKEFFCLVEIVPHPDTEDSFFVSATSLADRVPSQVIQGAVQQIVRERRAQQLGISADALHKLDAPTDFSNQRITENKTEKVEERDFVFAYLLPVMLIFGLFGLISFQSERLLTALMEEKLKRLLEVLLTRVTIGELLAGKMLGILYVGAMLYVGVGVVSYLALTFIGTNALISAKTASFLLDPKTLFFYTLFYLSGYALYASFYAAIGASCQTPKDAENLSMPLRMLSVFPIFISVYVTIHPQSGATRFFSLLPLTAPFVMINRLVVADVSLPELFLAVVIVCFSAAVGLWFATRIFRASLLAQGRSLSPRDVWKALVD